MLTPQDTVDIGAVSIFRFRFTAARAAVHAWLVASLSERKKRTFAKELLWPDAPQPLERVYYLASGGQVLVQSLNDQTVRVIVTCHKLPPLITSETAP